MATHDPILALLAHSRIVLKGGGIAGVRLGDAEEAALLQELQRTDAALMAIREKLRRGERLSGSSLGSGSCPA
ncbi:hypothetical protein D3C72_2150080 [compost metagenome]